MFQQPFEQFLSEDITTQIQQWEPRNSSGTDEMGEGCKSGCCGEFSAQDERNLPGPWGDFPLSWMLSCLRKTALRGLSTEGKMVILCWEDFLSVPAANLFPSMFLSESYSEKSPWTRVSAPSLQACLQVQLLATQGHRLECSWIVKTGSEVRNSTRLWHPHLPGCHLLGWESFLVTL